jgi:uncharacterized protein
MKTNRQNEKGTALITGASSGIGAIYADRLAKRGFNLILVARDRNKLDILATRLADETGVKTESFQADLTSKTDLARIEERLRNDQQITLLLNNAGMSVEGPLLGGDLDQIETMIQLNVIATTRLAGAVAPAFVARGRGTIINIASVLALAPELFNGAYSGTKAYLLNLSQALHQEIGAKGVSIQAVLPGATRTAIWEKSGTDVSKLPAGILMEVDEMVDAALAGLDLGEIVTIPSLPNIAEWEAFNAARLALGPNLSRDHAANRYKTAISKH